MSLNRQRGKAAERAVAHALGGKRTGTMGGEDVHLDGPFSVEVKSRRAFVAADWVDQAVRNAPPGKTPLVVVHVHGKRHTEDLVILRLSDWQDWHGSLVPQDAPAVVPQLPAGASGRSGQGTDSEVA